MDTISHDELLRILHYDPDNGYFTWNAPRPKIRVGNRAGYHHHRGYRRIEINGKGYAEHRLAWFYMTGRWPIDQIDHINRNPSDNRWGNLREATNSQNRMNTRPHIMRGISRCDWLTEKPYRVVIKANKKSVYLGCFATIEEARKAFDDAAKMLHGDFCAT